MRSVTCAVAQGLLVAVFSIGYTTAASVDRSNNDAALSRREGSQTRGDDPLDQRSLRNFDPRTDPPTLSPTTLSPTTLSPTTLSPTLTPTAGPTITPTGSPTVRPTPAPTRAPSPNPTRSLTKSPITNSPTDAPTSAPTGTPTGTPTTQTVPVTSSSTSRPQEATDPATASSTSRPQKATDPATVSSTSRPQEATDPATGEQFRTSTAVPITTTTTTTRSMTTTAGSSGTTSPTPEPTFNFDGSFEFGGGGSEETSGPKAPEEETPTASPTTPVAIGGGGSQESQVPPPGGDAEGGEGGSQESQVPPSGGDAEGGDSGNGGTTQQSEGTVVTWSSILVTLLFSVIQGWAFFAFFIYQRGQSAKKNKYELYESRQFADHRHRSPPPYDGVPRGTPPGLFGWAVKAFQVSDDDLVRSVGLDSYMFLRVLRLGARLSFVGAAFGIVVLIPVYFTGEGEGPGSEQFNSITMSNIGYGSSRLWAPLVGWWVFVFWIMVEFVREWRHYGVRRREYLARGGGGDVDRESRYSVMVEDIPPDLQSNERVREYFNRFFPGKVRQVNICLETATLDKLVAERRSLLLEFEKAEAQLAASGGRRRQMVRSKSMVGSFISEGTFAGHKFDLMGVVLGEIDRLNREIDARRRALCAYADDCAFKDRGGPTPVKNKSLEGGASSSSSYSGVNISVSGSPSPNAEMPKVPSSGEVLEGVEQQGSNLISELGTINEEEKQEVDVPPPAIAPTRSTEETVATTESSEIFRPHQGARSALGNPTSPQQVRPRSVSFAESATNLESRSYYMPKDLGPFRMTSTAFVTFTSLRAKQAAVQCELTGEVDLFGVKPAPEPHGVIWKNVPMAGRKAYVTCVVVGVVWIVCILFWAIPVTFVTGLANLDAILQTLRIENVSNGSFVYGLISGLLPVWALNLLMLLIPMTIGAVATNVIRMKSMPAVESYTYLWTQLFHVAQFWFILVGGSLFNQIDVLLNNPTEVVNAVATAMTGSSVFFINLIVYASFAKFGMELSMLPAYGMKLFRGLFTPEAKLTQRQLDEIKKPKSIAWRSQLPPLIFIFLVAVAYMPIVPILEVFAVVFFAGSYIVMKHQCLHVYAQEFEGGGVLWQTLFAFLMGCLYMAQLIFIAVMGIKGGGIQSFLGFVPLVGTVAVHVYLKRNLIRPLSGLPLEVAAAIDITEGELEVIEDNRAYLVAVEGQPYGQPVLKSSRDELFPMQYRREDPAAKQDVEAGQGSGTKGKTKGGPQKGATEQNSLSLPETTKEKGGSWGRKGSQPQRGDSQQSDGSMGQTQTTRGTFEFANDCVIS